MGTDGQRTAARCGAATFKKHDIRQMSRYFFCTHGTLQRLSPFLNVAPLFEGTCAEKFTTYTKAPYQVAVYPKQVSTNSVYHLYHWNTSKYSELAQKIQCCVFTLWQDILCLGNRTKDLLLSVVQYILIVLMISPKS